MIDLFRNIDRRWYEGQQKRIGELGGSLEISMVRDGDSRMQVQADVALDGRQFEFSLSLDMRQVAESDYPWTLLEGFRMAVETWEPPQVDRVLH